jgi:hypothetical protein
VVYYRRQWMVFGLRKRWHCIWSKREWLTWFHYPRRSKHIPLFNLTDAISSPIQDKLYSIFFANSAVANEAMINDAW